MAVTMSKCDTRSSRWQLLDVNKHVLIVILKFHLCLVSSFMIMPWYKLIIIDQQVLDICMLYFVAFVILATFLEV